MFGTCTAIISFLGEKFQVFILSHTIPFLAYCASVPWRAQTLQLFIFKTNPIFRLKMFLRHKLHLSIHENIFNLALGVFIK